MAAESVVSAVVGQLGNLIEQEVNFLSGVSGQVEQMQRELKMMQSYLEDADRRQDEDRTLQAWVSEIREAAYDAEAVIETYFLKVASRRRGGIQNAFKRYACILDEAKEIHKVGSEIEAINTRISNLRSSLQNHGIVPQSDGECSSSTLRARQNLRRVYSHIVEEYTVGLDGAVKDLVALLVNEEKPCGVVSIWGMGGLGKTTLAKKIYHHSDIRRHFNGFTWASVSQQFQPRNIWEGILIGLISPSQEQRQEIKGLSDKELVKRLYEVQQKKKYLVILDDIWRIDAWDSLGAAFPVGKAGSKILLTTRNKAVAEHADPRGFLHELLYLNEEDSWKLLRTKAFPKEDDPDSKIDPEMEELGRKMLERCNGLPLAIIVLGGILYTKHSLYEMKFLNSLLGEGDSGKTVFSVLDDVLALSYQELPYQLKPCFLHLGHFSEDYDIPTKKLIRIWVAERIVSPHHEETLEDVAEDYVGELLNRGMVQVGVRGSSGRVKTCRLDRSMRDLCCSKTNQENFLKTSIIRDGNELMVSNQNLSPQVHRVAVYLSDETSESLSRKHEGTPNLMSLLFFSTDPYGARISQKIIGRFSDCKLLKILDLESCYIAGKLTRAIGTLINLRYLSLNCSLITNIPSSIGNLRRLETLILQTYWSVEIGVPNMIWKMGQLRHLYLPTYIKKSSDKLLLGNLSNLQTLQGFDTRTCDAKGLIELTNLKKLGISHLKRFEEVEAVLASSRGTLTRLRSLNISVNSTIEKTDLQGLFSSCRNLHKLTLGGRIEKLPEHHEFPSGLNKLTLRNSHLEEDPMATLEKLPQLRILYLRVGSFVGKNMVCSEGFPQLKSLVLSSFHYLEEWKVEEKAMPNLCELVLENCMKLKMVPDGLRSIPTLRELKILNMPIAFKRRLQEGDDKHKVQHVPSIIFK